MFEIHIPTDGSKENQILDPGCYELNGAPSNTHIKKNAWGFPGGSDGNESACNAGDPGLILVLGRSPGEGNGYPLQYPSLENYMDRGAWRALVHGVTNSWTQLSD